MAQAHTPAPIKFCPELVDTTIFTPTPHLSQCPDPTILREAHTFSEPTH